MNGLAFADRYGSMSCESASDPLAAIVAAGSPASRSGSTTAASGTMSGLRRLALTSPADSTALRVTSEPVPAVVGTATHGSGRAAKGRPCPTTSRWSSGSVPEAVSAAIAFAASSALPPPYPSTPSRPEAVAAVTASRTSSTVGSPATAKLSTSIPSASRAARTPSAREVVAPVTTKTRRTRRPVRRPGTWATRPAPKRMSVGRARSKCVATVVTSRSRRGRR